MNEQHLDALPPVQPSAPPAVPAEPQGGPQPVQPPASAPVSPGAPAGPIPPIATAPPPTPAPVGPSATEALIADDVDLIEKEWVHKAKEVVERTKHDPFQQNQEITKVRNDYLKKRYNRDVADGKA